MANDRKYLVYKITNRFDSKIYIGVHSTLNKNDRYMGSGTEIIEALKKYGRKSFIKEILFECDTHEEMLAKEKELVTKEFCMREDTYNRIEGGSYNGTEGMITVKDKNGNTGKVYCDDPRYISGELVSNMKGVFHAKDVDGNIFTIDKNDPRYLSGELVSIQKGIFIAVDKFGNIFQVTKDDPRWISGELTGRTKGKKILDRKGTPCTSEQKRKIGEANSVKQRGSGNSQFGTCWITKDGYNKKIKKESLDAHLEQGWIKGRKQGLVAQ